MTFLHVFTEEESARRVFDVILPKILPNGIYFRVYSHQGKNDLEKALKTTLPTISKIPGSRILITRDQDSSDCNELKEKLNELISTNCFSPYLIRILCRELESWFLGDLDAIKKAFPRFNIESYKNKTEFRSVDKIVSPNLFMLKIIPEFSRKEYLPKLEVANKVAPHLNIEQNSSTSFSNTISGIKKLISQ